jgi:NAD(P)-dependent dehydrogenase (short-subunit alcohol dehydrogenase family)
MSTGSQRVVLITGASSGIGRACANYLARHGFRVYGTSRHAPGPQAVSTGLDPAVGAGSLSMLAMDVTDAKSVEDAVTAILKREARLDILVNNAGMGIAGPLESTSIEEATRQFDVNFFGAFRLCCAVLPAMRRQGEGYIVNIGSIGGVIAIPYQGLYSASKFALEGMSEALRLEARSMGVRVVVIQPGDYKTAFTQNRRFTSRSSEEGVYHEPFRNALERMANDERSGPDPEEIARLLHRIVEMRNPRLRYTAGKNDQRAAAWMKRLLPYSIIERGIRRYYRL